MLPRDLQRIVDEYVGKGFTQCEIGTLCGSPIGAIGGNKVMVFVNCMFEIHDYINGRLEICDDAIHHRAEVSEGIWLTHTSNTITCHVDDQTLVSKWDDNIYSVQIRKDRLWIDFADRFVVYDYKQSKVVTIQRCKETCQKTPTWIHSHEGQLVLHRTSAYLSIIHNRVYDNYNHALQIHFGGTYEQYEGDSACEYGHDAFVYNDRKWQIVDMTSGQVIQIGKFRYDVYQVLPMSNHRLLIYAKEGTFIMC